MSSLAWYQAAPPAGLLAPGLSFPSSSSHGPLRPVPCRAPIRLLRAFRSAPYRRLIVVSLVSSHLPLRYVPYRAPIRPLRTVAPYPSPSHERHPFPLPGSAVGKIAYAATSRFHTDSDSTRPLQRGANEPRPSPLLLLLPACTRVAVGVDQRKRTLLT